MTTSTDRQTIPAHVASTMTARVAYLRATCTNLVGMAERAVERGDSEVARDLLAELAPFAAELGRLARAGWAA